VKALLWDLDDTVLHTLPGRMRALKHAHDLTVGGWVDPEALWRSHRGGTLEAMGERLLGADGPRFVTAYRDFYYGKLNRAAPFEGIVDVLTECRASGLLLGIVTSKISWGATEELEAAGLLEYFGAVVGCDDTEANKPDPAPIFEALARLVVDDVARVAMVGDSPADIFAARNAGSASIAATWGSLDIELLLDSGPTYVARTPAGVLEAVALLRAGVPG
jgi:phosphoglycolate phosphatase-like HAD superfamily hydrolase